jgi:hypothetical protein
MIPHYEDGLWPDCYEDYQSVLWTAVLAAIVAMYSVLLGSLMNLMLVSEVFPFH